MHSATFRAFPASSDCNDDRRAAFPAAAFRLVALVVAAALCGTARAEVSFQDAWVELELPNGWSIEGESGEYMLDSDGEDIASLLVLARDPDRTLEELLADIEAQFLSTGIFTLESMEEREVDGTAVHVRLYRMASMAQTSESSTTTMIHQFTFWREDVQVLLQVETGEKSASPERLFGKIFSSLEVIESPDRFLYEDSAEFEDEGVDPEALDEEFLEDAEDDTTFDEEYFDNLPADSSDAAADTTAATPE